MDALDEIKANGTSMTAVILSECSVNCSEGETDRSSHPASQRAAAQATCEGLMCERSCSHLSKPADSGRRRELCHSPLPETCVALAGFKVLRMVGACYAFRKEQRQDSYL